MTKLKAAVNKVLSELLYFAPSIGRINKITRPAIDCKNIKVALVKQDVYTNLYCAPTGATFLQTLSSSLKHSGPAELFRTFQCDMHIVRVDAAEECSIWKQKITHCRQGDANYYESQRQRASPHNPGWVQGELAKRSGDVDWGSYDIVISLDIAVPASTVAQFKRVLWCYYVSEPCMPAYRASRPSPLAGYDIFLNQRFSPTLRARRQHELNFPFAFQRSGTFSDLSSSSVNAKEGIFIESHTESLLTASQRSALSQFGTLRTTQTSTFHIIESLLSSKYFVRLGGRRLWGNSMVEAVACGAIAIVHPGEHKNSTLVTRETRIRSFEEMLTRLADFESDPRLAENARMQQAELLDYYCYWKPLTELLDALARKRGAVSHARAS